MSILIRGALVLDGEGGSPGPADILIDGDRITRVAPAAGGSLLPTVAPQAGSRVPEGTWTPEGPRVIDAAGMAAVSGLANCHAHSAMALFRGIAEDMELGSWLREAIWPREAKLGPDDIYWGTRLAALEMIATGTTVCNDMYLDPLAQARAARDSGMRFVVGYLLIDGFDEARGEDQRRKCEAFFSALPDFGQLVSFCLAGHSVYATSPASLKYLGRKSRELGLLLHIHLAETEEEDRDCRSRTGLSPAAYLDSLGALGPLTVAAHCLWLDEKDFDLLADRGVAIAHNPASNMKLASGPAFDYAAAKSRGIRVVLGTDGAASNDGLDLFSDMRLAGLLQKHEFRDAKRFPVAEILRAATTGGHDLLGTGAGRIREGAAADLVLLDLRRPAMTPIHDLEASIVYAGSGASVDTVICAGRILARGGRIDGADEVMAEASSRARALTGS